MVQESNFRGGDRSCRAAPLFVPHITDRGSSASTRASTRASTARDRHHTEFGLCDELTLIVAMGTLSQADEAQLKAQLQGAVIGCTERCLYHSAKWCVL